MAKPGEWWITVNDQLIQGPGFDYGTLVEVVDDKLVVRRGADPDHPTEIPLDKLNELLHRKPQT